MKIPCPVGGARLFGVSFHTQKTLWVRSPVRVLTVGNQLISVSLSHFLCVYLSLSLKIKNLSSGEVCFFFLNHEYSTICQVYFYDFIVRKKIQIHI